VIPDEAVYAAAFAVYGSGFDGSPQKEAWLKDFRVALEAAAPYMLHNAWIEGFNTGMEYGEWWAGPATRPEPDNSNANPYGAAK